MLALLMYTLSVAAQSMFEPLVVGVQRMVMAFSRHQYRVRDGQQRIKHGISVRTEQGGRQRSKGLVSKPLQTWQGLKHEHYGSFRSRAPIDLPVSRVQTRLLISVMHV